VIYFSSPALFGRPFRFFVRLLTVVCSIALIGQIVAAKASHLPRVRADASLVAGLITAPVPKYPLEAAEKQWGGFGVFELRFRRDGTVQEVVTVLTTEHKLLDEAARAALLQWRCKPRAQSSARMTMSFSIHHDPVTLNPLGNEALKNIPVHPLPTYPLEARRQWRTGGGLFIMRFRQDGSVEKVVALHSAGHVVLDEECVRTLQRWRCLPGVYVTAYIPVAFTMSQ
jgi:TonB family protein